MTQAYDPQGRLRGASIVRAGPCSVVRVKSASGPDGYAAAVLGYGAASPKRLTKPVAGQFKAAGVGASRVVREFRISSAEGLGAGQTVRVADLFKPGDYVDVRGVSKGGGFAGTMKRHNFRGLPGSHGASDKERSPGSLTSRRSLGRVLPGQRMAGHMGAEAVCVQKIMVLRVDAGENLLYLAGSVPGPNGGLVSVSETVKRRKFYVEPKKAAVLKDKMGNIIQAKKPSKAKSA